MELRTFPSIVCCLFFSTEKKCVCVCCSLYHFQNQKTCNSFNLFARVAKCANEKQRKKTPNRDTDRTPNRLTAESLYECVPNISAQFTAQYFMTLTQFNPFLVSI